jgi:hypothetical protein
MQGTDVTPAESAPPAKSRSKPTAGICGPG